MLGCRGKPLVYDLSSKNFGLERALLGAPPERRPTLLAQGGFWYDAVGAAADFEAVGRHAALDALMSEVGLVQPTEYGGRTMGISAQ
jgi:hypothetical protein